MPDDYPKKVDDQFPDIQPGPRSLQPTDEAGQNVNAVSHFSDYGEGATAKPIPAHEEARIREEQLQAQQAQGTADPTVQPQDDRGGGIAAMEKRINRLYGQWKTAEEGKSAMEERYAALEQKYEALEARFSQAARPPVAGTPALPPQSQVGYPGFQGYGQPPNAAPVPPAAPPAGPNNEVMSAIQALNERLDRRDQMEALGAQQEQAYAAAVAEFPELKDQNSALAHAARQVFQRDPNFRLDPQGPYRAVIMARGLMADRVANEAGLETARRAAATPQATAVGTEGTTLAQIKSKYDAVLERMQRGIGNSHENWKEAQGLKREYLARGGRL
jgi:hypothetical protein